MLAPPFVVACLLLTNYCFVLVEVIVRYQLLQWYSYIYISLYELLFLMIVWSYVRLAFSDPGYIPKNYAY